MLIMDAPKTPKTLALLTGTQLPSFHSHKLVPTSDKSPESPRGKYKFGGHNMPPLPEIGLTDLSKSWGAIHFVL